jgi:2-amino-4-hydroxy-6-hydroxymethyldihydropteridine diphosphokinase
VNEPIVYVGLGANLGDTRTALACAYAELQQLPGTSAHRCSGLFRSAPVDSTGPDYLNAVACFSTSMSPEEVESHFHSMLTSAGHARATGKRSGREWFFTNLEFLDALATLLKLETHKAAEPR